MFSRWGSFFFSCSPLFFMLAIGMTTTLLLLSLTCRTQIKHICISCSVFFSSYLDSFQSYLENVMLCTTSLRLDRPLLVSSSRCLAFCEPCHEPASFYTEGGEFLEGPIQKLPEDSDATVVGMLGERQRWGWRMRWPGPKVCVPLYGCGVTSGACHSQSESS